MAARMRHELRLIEALCDPHRALDGHVRVLLAHDVERA